MGLKEVSIKTRGQRLSPMEILNIARRPDSEEAGYISSSYATLTNTVPPFDHLIGVSQLSLSSQVVDLQQLTQTGGIPARSHLSVFFSNIFWQQ